MVTGYTQKRLFELNVFVIAITLLILVSNVQAFEDNFQNHPSDDITDMWYRTTSHNAIVSYEETYNKVLRGYNYYPPGGTQYIENKNAFDGDYFSYVLRDRIQVNNGRPTYLYLFDVNKTLLFSKDISSLGNSYHDNNLYEYLVSSDNLYLYIDGNYYGNLGTCLDSVSYVRFAQVNEYSHSAYNYYDCFSTEGFVLGLGTSESPGTWVNVNSNNEINLEYTFFTIYDYDDWTDYDYRIDVTYLQNDHVVNSTNLPESKPSGYLTYNRSELMEFPDYGIYRFDLVLIYPEPDDDIEVVVESQFINFLALLDTGYMTFDKEVYSANEDINVSFSVDSYNTDDYTYFIKTYELDTNKYMSYKYVNQGSGYMTFELGSLYNYNHDFYSVLYKKNKESGLETALFYETFSTLYYDFTSIDFYPANEITNTIYPYDIYYNINQQLYDDNEDFKARIYMADWNETTGDWEDLYLYEWNPCGYAESPCFTDEMEITEKTGYLYHTTSYQEGIFPKKYIEVQLRYSNETVIATDSYIYQYDYVPDPIDPIPPVPTATPTPDPTELPTSIPTPDPSENPTPPPAPTPPDEPPEGEGANESINSAWVSGYCSSVDNMTDGFFGPAYNFTYQLSYPLLLLNDTFYDFTVEMENSLNTTSTSLVLSLSFLSLITNSFPQKIINVMVYYLMWVCILLIFKGEA